MVLHRAARLACLAFLAAFREARRQAVRHQAVLPAYLAFLAAFREDRHPEDHRPAARLAYLASLAAFREARPLAALRPAARPACLGTFRVGLRLQASRPRLILESQPPEPGNRWRKMQPRRYLSLVREQPPAWGLSEDSTHWANCWPPACWSRRRHIPRSPRRRKRRSTTSTICARHGSTCLVLARETLILAVKPGGSKRRRVRVVS